MKKALVSCSLLVFVLLTTQTVFGITIDLSARKMTVNDGRDDSAIVQKAITDVLAGGGGTVIFPSGVTDINTGIAVAPEYYKPVNLILQGDGGAVIRISVGSKGTAFGFGNLNQLKITNLVFTGKNVPIGNPEFIDARYVFFIGYVAVTTIQETSFFGIAVPSGGSIIQAATNLTVDNCQFEGLNAAYPDGAVIGLDCCTSHGQNATISHSTFVDYGFFGDQYYSKTPAFTANWIKAKQVYYMGSTINQRLTIEDTFFDEGAAVAINAQNIGAVILRGLRININGTAYGTGLKLDNITRARIEDTVFGYAASPRPLGILSKSNVQMIGVTRTQGVQCPTMDAQTTINWTLSDCE